MAVPVLKFEFWWVMGSFLVLEAMVGMFNGCGATMRSKYFPESMQSSIMSVFRLPLNVLVVAGTKLTDHASDIAALQKVYSVVLAVHVMAFGCQLCLMAAEQDDPREVEKKMKPE